MVEEQVEEQVEQQELSYPEKRRSTTVEGIANTLELVVTALILAFVFRAFVAEAFRIPTGSMADTLHGSHFHMRCIRCGYGYDLGGDDSVSIVHPACPSCGYIQPPRMDIPISNGDRILVLKCVYQFFEPKRWDVIVFKNPTNPHENYIKRLIALPEEEVQIIDGDIFIKRAIGREGDTIIRGERKIARKPPKVQEEMWMPVYENDYQALAKGRVLPRDSAGVDTVVWRQPFENEGNSSWNTNADGPTVFSLHSEAGDVQTLVYNSAVGNDFRAAYAYNDSMQRSARPLCSDLMVRFDVRLEGSDDRVGVALTKYGVRYEGSVDASGKMLLAKVVDGVPQRITSRDIGAGAAGKHQSFQFANVDRQLVLECGGEKLRHYLDIDPIKADERRRLGAPEVRILGDGKVTLWHVGVFRDTYYIGEPVVRAGERKSFALKEDQFFACGDNSPASSDSRLWGREGVRNSGVPIDSGVVPREYMMGKAFFVYWSDAFKLLEFNLPIIPNLGGIKVINGGSKQEF